MISCLCESWFDEAHVSGVLFRRASLLDSRTSNCQYSVVF